MKRTDQINNEGNAGVSRRRFIGTAALSLVAVGSGLAGCSPARPENDPDGKSNEEESAAPMPREPIHTLECDILVVGSGTAGMCAAVKSAELGKTVILAEKNKTLGGASGFTEGLFAVESDFQKEQGITTTADEIFAACMDYHHWAASGPVLRSFIDNSGETINWLMAHGVKIVRVIALGASAQVWHAYEPHGTALTNLIEPLTKTAEELGVQIITDSPIDELIQNEDGSIAGAYANTADGDVEIKARAVILCSGGYASSDELFQEFVQENPDDSIAWGPDGRDGDGITMGRTAGALLHHPGCVMFNGATVEGATTFYDWPNILMTRQPNLRINENGERYFNESIVPDFSSYGASLATQVANYSIIDQSYIDILVNEGCFNATVALDIKAGDKLDEAKVNETLANTPGILKAETIDDLAAQLGLDANSVKATIEKYNGYAETGLDLDFGKPAQYLQAFSKAPFYGSKVTRTYFTTVGGLKVDASLRVLNTEGSVIQGLYACGGDAGGAYGSQYDVNVASGSQQGWAATGGRIAAQHAAEQYLR